MAQRNTKNTAQPYPAVKTTWNRKAWAGTPDPVQRTDGRAVTEEEAPYLQTLGYVMEYVQVFTSRSKKNEGREFLGDEFGSFLTWMDEPKKPYVPFEPKEETQPEPEVKATPVDAIKQLPGYVAKKPAVNANVSRFAKAKK